MYCSKYQGTAQPAPYSLTQRSKLPQTTTANVKLIHASNIVTGKGWLPMTLILHHTQPRTASRKERGAGEEIKTQNKFAGTGLYQGAHDGRTRRVDLYYPGPTSKAN